MTPEDCTLDKFLGGRVEAAQPRRGFRAGHDTVLLAAAIPAVAGARCLELGAGAGIVSLCLAARVPGVEIVGVEIDPELVKLANENAARDRMAARVRFVQGDAASFAQDAKYDHVFFNPPFYPASGQLSPSPERDRAMRDTAGAVAAWTRVALGLTKPGGSVTAILRADRMDEMRNAGEGSATVFPLFPHAGEAPKRVIVQISKTAPGPSRTLAGLVLHLPDGKPTPEAEAVLRHAAALSLA